MDFIFIDDLRVEAQVGIYDRERISFQTLQISLKVGLPDEVARDDHIARTIDYAVVIARIRKELAARRFKLLESLGEFVVELMLNEFGAPWARISVAKLGVMKGVGRVGVQIERSR